MKNHLENLVRILTIGLLVSLLFICSQAQTKKKKQPRWNWETHQAEIIDYAKKYPVSGIEANLPRQDFEKWFRKLVGKSAKVNWEINDCGEQSGTRADRGRDFPLCVEAVAAPATDVSVSVSIQYGTFKGGIERGKPDIRNIYVGREDNPAKFLDTLTELSEKLSEIID